jgi:GcrA cell cycle regulator
MEWTKERTDELERLWADGMSARRIGELFGTTKNAVIGKVNRMRLPSRRTVVSVARKKLPPKVKTKPLPPPPVTDIPDPEPHERVKLLDLERNHCRWPIGDPGDAEFGFCGRGTAIGSYCPQHAKRAFDYVPGK